MPTEHRISSKGSVLLSRIAIGFWTLFIIIVVVKCIISPRAHSMYYFYANTGRIWWFGSTGLDPGIGLYGPFFAQLMGPFCALSDELGGALWYVFTFGFFLFGLYKFLNSVLPELNNKTRSVLFLLVPWCGIASFYNGQANIIIAGCLLWAVVAIRAKHWLLGGFALAASACIKVYPIVMAIVLIGLYPKKLLHKFLFATVILLCLPFVFHKPDFVLQQYADWVDLLTSDKRYTHVGWKFVDFRMFLARCSIVISPQNYIPVQVITGLLIFVCMYIYRRAWDCGRRTLLFAYVLTSIWLVLFGPSTEEATFLLAGPAVSWLLVEAYRRKKVAPIIYLTIAFLFVGPFQTSIFGEGFRKWVLAQKLAPLALMIFFVHQIVKTFRRPVMENQEKSSQG